jgi:hypothetical protein
MSLLSAPLLPPNTGQRLDRAKPRPGQNPRDRTRWLE